MRLLRDGFAPMQRCPDVRCYSMIQTRHTGDSSEESTTGGVSVPVVGLVTPAVADDDELSADGGRIRGA